MRVEGRLPGIEEEVSEYDRSLIEKGPSYFLCISTETNTSHSISWGNGIDHWLSENSIIFEGLS